MPTSCSQKICLLVGTSESYRHIFHFLLPALKLQGVDCCVISTNFHDEVASLCAEVGVPVLRDLPYNPPRTWASRAFQFLAFSIWGNEYPNSTRSVFEKQILLTRVSRFLARWRCFSRSIQNFEEGVGIIFSFLEKLPLIYKLFSIFVEGGCKALLSQWIGGLVGCLGLTAERCKVYSAWLDRKSGAESFWNDQKPSWLVMEAGAHNIVYASAAVRANIKVALYVPSWDRIPKHGPQESVFKHLFVWGPMIRRQALEFLKLDNQQITEVGGLAFDAYVHNKEITSREAFCEMHGIPVERKIIFYAIGQGRYARICYPIVRLIHEVISENDFPFDCHIIARDYPMVGERSRAEQAVPATRFSMQVPTGQQDFNQRGWKMDGDLKLRHSTFVHCDVAVVPVGSALIDAMVLGKPVVMAYFDAEPIPSYESSRHFLEAVHCKYAIQILGLSVAKSKAELREAVVEALTQPESKASERVASIKDIMGWVPDGRSHERLSQGIKDILSRP